MYYLVDKQSLSLSISLSLSLLPLGPLLPVTNLIVHRVNKTYIDITWNSPYTLLHVPIFNYHLILTGLYTNITLTYIITTTHLLLQVPNICDNYIIEIMATNEAGNGNTTNATISIIEGIKSILIFYT